jgi:plastocyanin
MEDKNTSRGLLIGIVIAALAIAGLIIFVLNNQPTAAPDSENNQANTPTGSAERDNEVAPNPSERMTITFNGDNFEPNELTVKKGTVITVKNESSRDVQFSSNDHPAHRDNTEMNLKTLAPGESASYTATAVGKWGFHDHIDESKTGTITVTE